MFESSNPKRDKSQLNTQQTMLDAQYYQILKDSEYEFTVCALPALQAKLGQHRAILEFKKFTRYELLSGIADEVAGAPWYGAFFITEDTTVFQSLGSAEEIETAVFELMDDIRDTDAIGGETISTDKLKRVESILFGPFGVILSHIREFYIVPDNELYKIPFELLLVLNRDASTENGDVQVCYLTSARSILRERQVVGDYKSIRIIADPKFDIDENPGKGNSHMPEMLDGVRSVLQSAGISCLKYAKLEAEEIAKVFSDVPGEIEIFQGSQARKANVFTKRTDILHFATHGFTILDQSGDKSQENAEPRPSTYLNRFLRIANCSDALLRCGLLLSGVNNWLRGAETDGFGNGILTGIDILSENLQGYQLAVLSACSTGQGSISYIGDGIEGLRSAFELAGVQALICTLWDVDDFSTALFMAEFYRVLHNTGHPLSALNAAKRMVCGLTYVDLKRKGFEKQANELFSRRLALSEDEKPFAHPKYWAGFILHGTALER